MPRDSHNAGLPPPPDLVPYGPAGASDLHVARRDGSAPLGVEAQGDVRRYLDVLRRRWRTALAVFVVVAGGLMIGTLLRAPVYRATGLLEIRPGSSAVPVEMLFTSERVATDELETQFGILRSGTLAERVVANLTATAGHGTDAPSGPDAQPSEARPPLSAERLRRDLVIDPQRGSRLVEVSFDAAEPAVAAHVVNLVLDTYLQLRMEEGARSAQWLETQLQQAQKQLDDTEGALQKYVRRHGLAVLETGGGELAQEVNERLRALSAALVEARAERFGKQSTWEITRGADASHGVRSPVMDTLVLRLADLRREHARLAAVFHDEYPSVLAVKSQIAESERPLAAEPERAGRHVQREYQSAVRREALLRRALDEQNATAQALASQTTGYQALRREVLSNQQLFSMLNQKLKEVSISSAMRAANVGIVDRPVLPDRPYGGSRSLGVVLAVLAGAMLSFGVVFLREHLDTSMRSVTEIESYLGVTTLAAIPAVAPQPLALAAGRPARPRGPWRRIDLDGTRPTPLAEAFAALRTAVLLDDGPARRSLLVTSAQSAEGKTTVALNLALSLARLQHRVLLIDANLRYPCIHDALGLDIGPGLVDYLTSEVYWGAFVVTEARPCLDVLVCGMPQGRPSDLLALPRMQELFEQTAPIYDFLIIDSPALLAHQADVRILATLADSVLLTVRHGVTPREAVSLALAKLPRVCGVVLNRSQDRDVPSHYRDAPAAISA
jgi:succinoglycan biosynthesis transport protein ExoP